jgi:hypothetical protein
MDPAANPAAALAQPRRRKAAQDPKKRYQERGSDKGDQERANAGGMPKNQSCSILRRGRYQRDDRKNPHGDHGDGNAYGGEAEPHPRAGQSNDGDEPKRA